MTHIETIKTLTASADEARNEASRERSYASEQRSKAADAERRADKYDLEAMAYEDSIDALQRLSTAEATA